MEVKGGRHRATQRALQPVRAGAEVGYVVAAYGWITAVTLLCVALTTKAIAAHLEAERSKTGSPDDIGSVGTVEQVIRLRADA